MASPLLHKIHYHKPAVAGGVMHLGSDFMFNPSLIKTETWPDILIRHPERYFEDGIVNEAVIANLIVKSAKLYGATNTDVLTVSDLCIVCADIDWFSMAEAEGVSLTDSFIRLTPFSRAGLNAIRGEAFCFSLSKEVSVIRNGVTIKLKGNLVLSEFTKTLANKWPTLIIFRLDSKHA